MRTINGNCKSLVTLACLLGLLASASGQDDHSDLRKMLLDRPDVPVTKPRGHEETPAEKDMPVDGSQVVSQECRIELRPETGWYLLTFVAPEEGQDTQPRWILPGKWLDSIEKRLARQPDTLSRVTGESLPDANAWGLMPSE